MKHARSRDRRAALLLCAFVAGCGAAPAKAPEPASAPASSAAPSAAPAAPWKTYADTAAGFSVALPAEPTTIHRHDQISKDPPGWLDRRALSLHDDDPATPDFDVIRLEPIPRVAIGVGRLADGYAKQWPSVDHREMKMHQGMAAIELRGVSPDGPTATLIVDAGGWTYIASVSAKGGVDPALAERFFGSLRLDLPWRIEVLPEQAVTFSVPAQALPDAPDHSLGASMYGFRLPGSSALYFNVMTSTMPRGTAARPDLDQVFEEAIRKRVQTQGARVEPGRPVEQGGMSGREFAQTLKTGEHARSRLFVVGQRVYVVTVGSSDPAVLTQETAERFLGSLRVGTVP